MIVIHENDYTFWMPEEMQANLREDPQDILWVHRGVYGLLPKGMIQNILRYREDAAKFWRWQPPLGFQWAETQTVSQVYGKRLEKENE